MKKTYLLSHVPDIREAVEFRIDNISWYFFEGTSQEWWDMDHFPNIMPPYDFYVMSYAYPERLVSEVNGIITFKQMTGGFDVPDHSRVFVVFRKLNSIPFFMMKEEPWIIEETHTVMRCDLYHVLGNVIMDPVAFYYCLNQWGAVIKHKTKTHQRSNGVIAPVWAWFMYTASPGARAVGNKLVEMAVNSVPPNQVGLMVYNAMLAGVDFAGEERKFTHPAFLATNLIHCNNVKVDHIVDRKVSKERRGKRIIERVREYKYDVINIIPNPTKRAASSNKRSNKPSHLRGRIGGFKDYRQGNGLFGKYHILQYFSGISEANDDIPNYSKFVAKIED